MIKPSPLKRGDAVATVSLSSGLAAALPHRYETGRKQVEETFGVTVLPAPNSQRDDEYLYRHPQARVDDLVWALTEPTVSGIIANIGGSESVRLLPLIDLSLVRSNPKVFMGFSDATIQHLSFMTAGVVSFYGPNLMTDLADDGGIHPFTRDSIRRTLFADYPPGPLAPAPEWTDQFVDWADKADGSRRRTYHRSRGWTWLQGAEAEPAEGHLIGGCMEVLEMLKGTPWWPESRHWERAVLFFETSELKPDPHWIEYWLRNYATQGILQQAAGVLFARPYGYSPEQKRVLSEVIRKVAAEVGRTDMPVVADMDFGHTSPMGVLPFGGHVRIEPGNRTITVIDPMDGTGSSNR